MNLKLKKIEGQSDSLSNITVKGGCIYQLLITCSKQKEFDQQFKGATEKYQFCIASMKACKLNS